MNPSDGWGYYCAVKCQHQILEKESFSPHIIPKTKGLEESLRRDLRGDCVTY